MKEFLKTNIVTYNLISFTGFKSMLIFSLLLNGPKTYSDIQKFLLEHEFLHEKVSIDTIRVYINTLKSIGCNVVVTKKGRIHYYSIDSHPFELKITDEQAKSIIKIYKAIANSISIEEYMYLQKFFQKFSKYITNEDLKTKFSNLSPLANVEYMLVQDLMKYSERKIRISVLYNSAHSGHKLINFVPDKLKIERNKLYLYGYNEDKNDYGSLLVSKIIKIAGVNIEKNKREFKEYKVVYEITDCAGFEETDFEKIVSKNDNIITVEACSKDKFTLIQRILSFANGCKVISPNSFRDEVISCLKEMKEGYLEK